MGWENSTRRARLPPNWATLRRDTFTRAGNQCEHRNHKGIRCNEAATDCDHIRPGDNHHPSNLQALCKPHHKDKSNREAKAAQHALYYTARKRTPERHPGLP